MLMKKDCKNSGNVDNERDNESFNPNTLPMLMKKDYESFHTNSGNVDDEEKTIV